MTPFALFPYNRERNVSFGEFPRELSGASRGLRGRNHCYKIILESSSVSPSSPRFLRQEKKRFVKSHPVVCALFFFVCLFWWGGGGWFCCCFFPFKRQKKKKIDKKKKQDKTISALQPLAIGDPTEVHCPQVCLCVSVGVCLCAR